MAPRLRCDGGINNAAIESVRTICLSSQYLMTLSYGQTLLLMYVVCVSPSSIRFNEAFRIIALFRDLTLFPMTELIRNATHDIYRLLFAIVKHK